MEVSYLSKHHLDTFLEHFEMRGLVEIQMADENATLFLYHFLRIWALEDFEFSMTRDIQRLSELFDWVYRQK
jgi:hypothetical protein